MQNLSLQTVDEAVKYSENVGLIKNIERKDGYNANNLIDTGIYYCASNCTNVPTSWCYIIVLAGSAYDVIQVAMSQGYNNYKRYGNRTTKTFHDWKITFSA